MTRIPVTSLLNNDNQDAVRPLLPTMSKLQIMIDLYDDTRKLAYREQQLSPTLSHTSIGSDSSSTRTRTPNPTHLHPLSHAPYERRTRPRHGRGSRQFRPSYDSEEAYFIWYHRIDLQLEWNQVSARFNKYFARGRTGCQGVQCKYYRFCQEHGLPAVRRRHRDPNAHRLYSLRTYKPEVWYDWMRPGATEI